MEEAKRKAALTAAYDGMTAAIDNLKKSGPNWLGIVMNAAVAPPSEDIAAMQVQAAIARRTIAEARRCAASSCERLSAAERACRAFAGASGTVMRGARRDFRHQRPLSLNSKGEV